MRSTTLLLLSAAAALPAAGAWRAPMAMVDRRGVLGRVGKALVSAPVVAAAAAAAAPQFAVAAEAVTTDSGLTYTVTKEGTGAMPAPGQSVRVHYTGWLDGFDEAGRKFDSSRDRGRPLVIPAGTGRVIAGWDEMLVGMKVGERRQVIIPPNMGYGKRGAGGVIPPDATLYFDMELLGIN
mmetsp:Transcript_16246/g.49635  ORF Transcript_16246/g.49635 Transcript_16246/m.49635 type:complete len:180 (-) Transcript_16246:141-680(-)|eukprot:CAMPEP_0118855068 /NCGR_PEP_ID=MMETSP1163-20130328/3036_1 /TAXON_ID=124430 /ORGANISM="Phaeomonas parva, Strain CCMP2877" /LENGTH=179 /DNA_ID=CAMNT_0006787895 /DNA_START=71 /DNA_END=610 /DNA_ORIENTATION=-